MMSNLRKKPHKMTARQHLSRMEVLNGYIGIMPMLKDNTSAVASMEKGNVPFNKATLAGIIMATCLVAWRNQYNLTHKTIPESP